MLPAINNKIDLKKALLEKWEKIMPEYTLKLVKSVPNRPKEIPTERSRKCNQILKTIDIQTYNTYNTSFIDDFYACII